MGPHLHDLLEDHLPLAGHSVFLVRSQDSLGLSIRNSS
jgi:hypothetical protein